MRHDDPLATEDSYVPAGDQVDSDDAPIPSGDEPGGTPGSFDVDDDELTGDDVEEDEIGI